MTLQKDTCAGLSAKPPIFATQTGGNSNRLRLPCPRRRRKQEMPPRRKVPRDKLHGNVECRRRESLVVIPEVEEEEGGEQVSDLDDKIIVQDSSNNAYALRPPGYCPVELRWESPKSTIQLEDLLFGIGSQFDGMVFSPQQLSYIHAANNCKDPYGKPQHDVHPSISVVSRTTTTATRPTGMTNNGLSLAAATITKKSKPGFYVRRLCGTLASTICRFLAEICNFLKCKRYNGFCTRNGHCHRNHQHRQNGEKSGDRGLIYLV